MGTMGPVLWTLFVLTLTHPTETQSQVINPAHNDRVCSTWGNFHFKTFDGDIFQFPGTCNYLFASNCKSTYEDFNIQIRRNAGAGDSSISYVVMKLEGFVIEIKKGEILVGGIKVVLPFSQLGVQIQRSIAYVTVHAKLGLLFMWNEDDALTLELPSKYMGNTCGLCGNMNGIKGDEFSIDNIPLTVLQYGNLQKLDGPTEQCENLAPSAPKNCSDMREICFRMLSSPAFDDCVRRVPIEQYVASCMLDLCSCASSSDASCFCDTLAEYSRQCAHAGGKPEEWRQNTICGMNCPMNMKYMECGSPCTNTCSNPERELVCEDHCTDGCFCPPGTLFDDVENRGCIPQSQCSCTHNNKTYAPGESYSTNCLKCICKEGQWSCEAFDCPGHCSLEGGSHINTYDGHHYTFHGECSYIFTKDCGKNTFTVLVELQRCGITETETCLKSVALSLDNGNTVVSVKSSGTVHLNGIYTQIPLLKENIIVFQPSTFYMIIQSFSGLQIQVQLIPIMQIFVTLDPDYLGETCGLCGNFNNIRADDFVSLGGVLEGGADAFGNSWTSQAGCPIVKTSFEDPCLLSVENEKYAKYWCSMLTNPKGVFSACHDSVNPKVYEKNCMFDSCNNERSEDSVCAAFSSYVRACAAEGIMLVNWRQGICEKPTKNCPKNSTYQYAISACQKTCRSLSEPDLTCSVKYPPVDGCGCPVDTFLDETGSCVEDKNCPCYYKGSPMPAGEVIYDNGAMCTCQGGRLNCAGRSRAFKDCPENMKYSDCASASNGFKGRECQKTCQTLDLECFSIRCVPGCLCPDGLVLSNNGSCIPKEECPCLYNGEVYHNGESIQQDCNTCFCKNRKWQCTKKECGRTCMVYGEGHYVTYDGKRFDFSGDCEYTVTQDYCASNTANGTFRVITENIPCGSTGATCTKAIKVFLGNFELKLSEGSFEVVERDTGSEVPYQVRKMGIYLVIEAKNGLILMWDRKTSIMIKLDPKFKGNVCGLCGNYDGSVSNDFMTRSLSVVVNVQEFANSWKASPTCPDAEPIRDPCVANPYRRTWSLRHCSIIMSPVFSKCHGKVDPSPFHESCVHDTCACDSGGDCECFCTAVAAYAAACNEAGICVAWRTPEICPLFCDYYNPEGECEWHYKPCGAPCMKTCRNPSGNCMNQLPGLEGCYPKCPKSRPYFDEDIMKCVALANCGCYDDDGKRYNVGDMVPSYKNCESCICTKKGRRCQMDLRACYCYYGNKKYSYGEVIYNTTDGIGGCITATCSFNGTIDRTVYPCESTTTAQTTPFKFVTTTSPASNLSTSEPFSPTSVSCLQEVCKWSVWYDVDCPQYGLTHGDFETFDKIRDKGYPICKVPSEIQCRAQKFPLIPVTDLGQVIHCNTSVGLLCFNNEQFSQLCFNYEIRVLCCSYVPCGESTNLPTSTPQESSPQISLTSTPPSTMSSSTVSRIFISSTFSEKTLAPTSISEMTTTTTNKSPVIDFTQSSPQPSTDNRQTTSNTTPCRKQRCVWTEWFDFDFPNAGPTDGDFETPENIAIAGGTVCEKPEAIKCRAELFPDINIENIGQIVTCNVTHGLICNNEDQDWKFPFCYNYLVAFLCCSMEDCESSTAPTYTTTTIKTSTAIDKTSVLTKTTENIAASFSTAVTTTKETLNETGPITSASTRLQTSKILTSTGNTFKTIPSEPECQWSEWWDVSYPNDDTYGDFETFENIRNAGFTVCDEPSNIQCRSSDLPEIPLDELFQNVHCNVTNGLVCMNEEQTNPFPFCYNYEIRVLCCSAFTSTTPMQSTQKYTYSTITTGHEKPSEASISNTSSTSSTSYAEIKTTIKTPKPSTLFHESTTKSEESSYKTSRSSTTARKSTTAGVRETTSKKATLPKTTKRSTPSGEISTLKTIPSEPECQWSEWWDVSYPNDDTYGDFETFENIRNAGFTVCDEPSNIQCRSSDLPEIPLDELFQNVHCNVTNGLVCMNEEQTNPFPFCYNYEIRVLCCSAFTSTTPMQSTQKYTYSTIKTSPKTTKFSTPSGEIKTTKTSSSEPGEITSAYKTSRPSTSARKSTTEGERETTSKKAILPKTTKRSTPSGEISTLKTIPSEPECQWSEWWDVSYPNDDTYGDFETFENIRNAGFTVCDEPSNIQCRSSDLPEIPLDELFQNVHCNVTNGLVCMNEEQNNPFPFCYNYEIRVLCCSSTTPMQSTQKYTYSTIKTSPKTTKFSTPSGEIKTTKTSSSEPGEITSAYKTSRPSTSARKSTTEGERETTSKKATPPRTTKVSTPSGEIKTTKTSSTKPGEMTSAYKTSRPSTSARKSTTAGVRETTSKKATLPKTTKRSTPSGEISTLKTIPSEPECQWSEWWDVSYPNDDTYGDFETFENIRNAGFTVCDEPSNIQCRSSDLPEIPLDELFQNVHCNVTNGLVCMNEEQNNPFPFCYNYEIRVLCCSAFTSTTPMQSTQKYTYSTIKTSPKTTKFSTPSGEIKTTKTSSSEPGEITSAYKTSRPSTSARKSTTEGERETTSKKATPPRTTKVSTPSGEIKTTKTSSTKPGEMTSAYKTSRPSTSARKSTTEGERETTSKKATTPRTAKVSTPSGEISTSKTIPSEPDCQWSEWWDVSYPNNKTNGDFETFENIRNAGFTVCDEPSNIQCRSSDLPQVPLDELVQIVHCNVTNGLVCMNEEQSNPFPICFNYEIRVLCCSAFTSTTPMQSTQKYTYSTIKTSPKTTKFSTPSGEIKTTKTSSSEPGEITSAYKTSRPITSARKSTTEGERETTSKKATTPRTAKVSTPSGEISTSKTIPSEPDCQWSEWWDVSYPNNKTNGDFETFENIRNAGFTVCDEPSNIQCRSSDLPQVPLDELVQIVHCNVTNGLVCMNEEQSNPFPICFNYEIRVLCCSAFTSTTPMQSTQKYTYSTIKTSPKTTTFSTPSGEIKTTKTSSSEPGEITSAYKTSRPSTSARKSTTEAERETTSKKATPPRTTKVSTPSGEIKTTKTSSSEPGEITSAYKTSRPSTSVRKSTTEGVRETTSKKATTPETIKVSTPSGEIKTTKTSSTEPGKVTSHRISLGAETTSRQHESRLTTTSNRVTFATTKCLCNYNGVLVPSGTVLYNTTDNAGWCFYARCNESCQVERYSEQCYSSTVPTTTASSTSVKSATASTVTTPSKKTSTASSTKTDFSTRTSQSTPLTSPTMSSSTPSHDCNALMPPRQWNETWALDNCTNATCVGNNKVVVNRIECAPVQNVVCTNRLQPKKIYDESGCCYQKMCECVCGGWGTSHYITFDGTYYDFTGQCTYVLVQQITPLFDHFRVYIDNFSCNPDDPNCIKTLRIMYKGDTVVLVSQEVNQRPFNEVYFNDERVYPAVNRNGIIITSSGIFVIVEIPELSAYISFNVLSFAIRLPFNKFQGNTEGHCGKCSNNRVDDCILPGGQLAPSCTQMAGQWGTPSQNTSSCSGTSTVAPATIIQTTFPFSTGSSAYFSTMLSSLPPATSSSIPPTKWSTQPSTYISAIGITSSKGPCNTPALCSVILSSVFKKCHAAVPPDPYYRSCIIDGCNTTEGNILCSSLESYARICATQGVCIDWRDSTNGMCRMNCSDDKVYKACGAPVEPTCNSKYNEMFVHVDQKDLMEGCYCPNGTVRFNTISDKCVSICGCTGPDGMPRQPGEEWDSNCQTCVCNNRTMSVQCTPKVCITPNHNCTGEGFIAVSVPDVSNPCCMVIECRCNISLCNRTKPVCDLGTEPVAHLPEGACCPVYTCEQKNVCVHNRTEYQVGATVPSSNPCDVCTCEMLKNKLSVICISMACDTRCPKGYTYQYIPGKCCGKCVQTHCIMVLPNNSIQILAPGQIWHPPGDNCTYYECVKKNDTLLIVASKIICPEINLDDCIPGTIVLDATGCCKICVKKPQECRIPKTKKVIILQNRCTSVVPVKMSYCSGNCDSYSIFSASANAMQRKCACCQETKLQKVTIKLLCPSGKYVLYTYLNAVSCACVDKKCKNDNAGNILANTTNIENQPEEELTEIIENQEQAEITEIKSDQEQAEVTGIPPEEWELDIIEEKEKITEIPPAQAPTEVSRG